MTVGLNVADDNVAASLEPTGQATVPATPRSRGSRRTEDGRERAYAAIGLTQTSSAYSLDTSGAGTDFRSTTQPAMTSCPGSGSQPLKSMTT